MLGFVGEEDNFEDDVLFDREMCVGEQEGK